MSQTKRILLVEDGLIDVKLTMAIFNRINIINQVEVVWNGEEALDYLYPRGKFETRPKGNPILILLDLRMPRVDGFEVLRQMKSNEQLKMIPVVVFTFCCEEKDVIECYKLGVNAFVIKPIDSSSFFKTIYSVISFWTAINKTAGSIKKARESPISEKRNLIVRKDNNKIKEDYHEIPFTYSSPRRRPQ